METTISFEEWLEQIDDVDDLILENNAENVHSLFCAVKNCENIGPFNVKKKGEQIFIEAEGEEMRLRIPTANARKSFCKYLIKKYVPEDMTLDGWRVYQRGMSRDD